MNITLTAIIPIIFLMVLGNSLRRKHFLATTFWAASDKLTYFILFPALLIAKVSQVDLSLIQFSQVFAFVAIYFPLVSLLAYIIYRLTAKNPKQFSSIYQGTIRYNTYIYFGIIEAVWGQHTLAIAALIAGIIIPIVNVCCVSAFAFAGGQFSLRNTTWSIVKNPLIIGALLGFLTNIFPWLMPVVLLKTFVILSTAALPLALLSVGAAVQIKTLLTTANGVPIATIWATALCRLLLVPFLAVAINRLLGIEGDVGIAFVLFAAVPTATSSYILSKQLNGDAEMMATLISLETVLSLGSLVIWLNRLT